jgi:predicted NBD/HSP70 family sugar kinase
MGKHGEAKARLPTHGGSVLPRVIVDDYSVELTEGDGFLGDRANKKAFWDLVEKYRKPLRKQGADPLGNTDTEDIGKKALVELLVKGDIEAAGLVHSAIEDFAQELATVIRRFLRLKAWRDTECLVIGGGFRGSRVGELAVGRCAMILSADGTKGDLAAIDNVPDDAGLIGAAHLLPPWMLKGHGGLLAVDVGGTNIRAGIVELNGRKSRDHADAAVLKSRIWRHSEEKIARDDAVERVAMMLRELADWAKRNRISLAPVVGIGCPGVINEDGSIERGAHNLPGNWESTRFSLPDSIVEHLPKVGEHETVIIMHNDAVLQGLSELPRMREREHWGVLTIGTGLGNARFTNRRTDED